MAQFTPNPNNPFQHLINPVLDPILQRRKPEWYLGKVMWLTGAAVPQGYPQGFFIPLTYDREHNWFTYHYIGPVLPVSAHGEPVYVNDGLRRDLKAVPHTVRPSQWVFMLWAVIYLVVSAVSTSWDPSHNPFPFFMFLPLIGIPFFQWFMAVEPVRGTKVALAILAISMASSHRSKTKAREALDVNRRYS